MINISHSCNIQHVMKKCIAFRNKKSKQICNRKIVHGDYCGYHQKKIISPKNIIQNKKKLEKIAILKIYAWWKNIKHLQIVFLNKNFPHFLVMGENSWKEIPFIYQFKINKSQWWDIRFLTKHFSQLLNHNDTMIPSPSFPNNPFNREPFTPTELNIYFHRAKKLKLPLNIALEKFKTAPYDSWYKCLKRNYHKNSSLITKKMALYFSKNMRYKIINQANSECSFIGHWVRRNLPLSLFEKTYRNWIKTPIYIKDPSGALIFNPEKDFCWMKMWQIDEEFWSVDDDETSFFR